MAKYKLTKDESEKVEKMWAMEAEFIMTLAKGEDQLREMVQMREAYERSLFAGKTRTEVTIATGIDPVSGFGMETIKMGAMQKLLEATIGALEATIGAPCDCPKCQAEQVRVHKNPKLN